LALSSSLYAATNNSANENLVEMVSGWEIDNNSVRTCKAPWYKLCASAYISLVSWDEVGALLGFALDVWRRMSALDLRNTARFCAAPAADRVWIWPIDEFWDDGEDGNVSEIEEGGTVFPLGFWTAVFKAVLKCCSVASHRVAVNLEEYKL